LFTFLNVAVGDVSLNFTNSGGQETVKSMRVGEALLLTVPHVHGTGFVWDKLKSSDMGAMVFENMTEGPSGGPHHHGAAGHMLFRYSASKASSRTSTVTLVYKRSWENSTKAIKSQVKVHIETVATSGALSKDIGVSFDDVNERQTVKSLVVGASLVVSVPYHSGTGYVWDNVVVPTSGALSFENATKMPGSHRGALGHMVFRFKAQKASPVPSELTMVRERPWEKNSTKVIRDKVTVQVEKVKMPDSTVEQATTSIMV